MSSYCSYPFSEDYIFLKIVGIRKVGIASQPHRRVSQNPETPGGRALKNAPNLMNLGLQMQRTGSVGWRESGWSVNELWTLLCLLWHVAFATVLLMMGLYPGVRERLERLRTYCTRQGRRDHPCSNAPFLPKNDRLAGVLGAALWRPLPGTSSIEDWSKGHPTHPATHCDLTAGG